MRKLSDVSPSTSVITGLQKRDSRPSNAVGTGPGRSGAAENAISIKVKSHLSIREILEAGGLEAWLRQRVEFSLEVETVPFIDPQYGMDFREVGMTFRGTQEALKCTQHALAVVDEPASREVLLSELLRLDKLTKRRHEDANDLELLLEAFIEELQAFPQDLAIEAMRKWPKRSSYFPAWNELNELIESGMRRRRLMRQALSEKA